MISKFSLNRFIISASSQEVTSSVKKMIAASNFSGSIASMADFMFASIPKSLVSDIIVVS